MAADINFPSPSIIALDSQPVGQVSAGLGAKGTQYSVRDYVTPTTVGLATIGSYYRLVRLPTHAILNRLEVATSTPLDTSASNTLAFVLGLAFSDNPNFDGTSPINSANIPTTANNGSVTTFAAFSSPNNLFGTITPAMMGHTAPYLSGNLLFNGLTGNYPLVNFLAPLWTMFGFTNARGLPANPGGMFDLYAYVTAAAATPAAGALMAYMEYTL